MHYAGFAGINFLRRNWSVWAKTLRVLQRLQGLHKGRKIRLKFDDLWFGVFYWQNPKNLKIRRFPLGSMAMQAQVTCVAIKLMIELFHAWDMSFPWYSVHPVTNRLETRLSLGNDTATWSKTDHFFLDTSSAVLQVFQSIVETWCYKTWKRNEGPLMAARLRAMLLWTRSHRAIPFDVQYSSVIFIVSVLLFHSCH